MQRKEAASTMGLAKKRTLAERYALVQNYRDSGMELPKYMESKGWCRSLYQKNLGPDQKDFLKWYWKASAQDWESLYNYKDESKGHDGKKYMEKHKKLPQWWSGLKMYSSVLHKVCAATLQEALGTKRGFSTLDVKSIVEQLVKNLCEGVPTETEKEMSGSVVVDEESIGCVRGKKRKLEDSEKNEKL